MKWAYAILIFFISCGVLYFFLRPIFWGFSEEDYNTLEKQFFLSNTTKVFTEQLKFREKAIAEYDNNLKTFLGETHLDSAFNNSVRNKIGIKYLVPQCKTTFLIPIDNYTIDGYQLVGIDSMRIDFSVDDEKINNILSTQNFRLNDFENVLRYNDYIKVTKKAYYHIRIIGILVTIAASIFAYFLLVFIDSIEQGKKDGIINKSILVKTLEETAKGRNIQIKENFKNLNLDELKEKYSKSLDEIDAKILKIEEINKKFFIVKDIADKAEIKMKEVGNRSNLMLIAGLIMAFLGVTVFYITLPNNISTTNDILKIVILSIRPSMILLFIEAISWYLLKQHKILLDEYKYYHNIFNKKMNYLAAYKLIDESDSTDISHLLPIMLLVEQSNNHSENDGKDDDMILETTKNLLTSITNKLLSNISSK